MIEPTWKKIGPLQHFGSQDNFLVSHGMVVLVTLDKGSGGKVVILVFSGSSKKSPNVSIKVDPKQLKQFLLEKMKDFDFFTKMT